MPSCAAPPCASTLASEDLRGLSRRSGGQQHASLRRPSIDLTSRAAVMPRCGRPNAARG
jgi:hypothetical protein